ncbi:MAG: hypothetical protein M1610_06495 [Nitrospirae bacterium]|nr:hypothetical protein [Nitrospirota bacterium]MCL5061975.1 hypothetical protein [Nitrospirota bacterium]MDA8338225.1 hypothetical protein [Nitrospiraceae bacterium]
MNKRKHYFINRGFQGRFILCFLIYGLFVTLSTSILIWHFSAANFDKFVYRSHILPITPWEAILPVMIKTIVVSSAVLVISAYLLANFIFKKISGELRRLNDAMENIGRGNLTVTIPGNNIKEINEALQMFIEKTREDVTSLKVIQKEMKHLVDRAGDAQDKETASKAMENISKKFIENLSACRIKVE